MRFSVSISTNISLQGIADSDSLAIYPFMALEFANSLINRGTPLVDSGFYSTLRVNNFPPNSIVTPAGDTITRGLSLFNDAGPVVFKIVSVSHRATAALRRNASETLLGGYAMQPLNRNWTPTRAAIPCLASPVTVTTAGLSQLSGYPNPSFGTNYFVPLESNAALAPNGSFQEQLGFSTVDRYVGDANPVGFSTFTPAAEYFSTTREMLPVTPAGGLIAAGRSVGINCQPYSLHALVTSAPGSNMISIGQVVSSYIIDIDSTTFDNPNELYAAYVIPRGIINISYTAHPQAYSNTQEIFDVACSAETSGPATFIFVNVDKAVSSNADPNYSTAGYTTFLDSNTIQAPAGMGIINMTASHCLTVSPLLSTDWGYVQTGNIV